MPGHFRVSPRPVLQAARTELLRFNAHTKKTPRPSRLNHWKACRNCSVIEVKILVKFHEIIDGTLVVRTTTLLVSKGYLQMWVG